MYLLHNALLFRSTALLVLLVMSSSKSVVFAQFVQSPMSGTAYLGDQISFSCVTDGSHLLVWTVNGVEARFPEVRDKGITFMRFGVNSEISNLTAVASIRNNNSEIICIQENLITGQEIARTPPAYLYVQGLLGAPLNISVDFRNETIIQLTWLPPFSLKDILSYNIIVVSSEGGNEIETRNITLPKFTYMWRPSLGYCGRFVFQVAAINAIGKGNRTREIVTSFLRPFIEVSPSNQTVIVEEWANFSCGVQCSLSEYITWFVQVNGSTFPLFEKAVSGLNIQSYPESSVCSISHALKRETHSVALSLSYELDLPLVIYCTLISVCLKNEPHCMTYSCYSGSAYVDIQGRTISLQSQSEAADYTLTSDDSKVAHTTPAGHNSDENLIQSYNVLFGASLGLGMILMVILLVVVIITIVATVLCRPKKKSLQQQEEDVVYDTIMPTVTVQPSVNDAPNLESCMVAPAALQYCPAYRASNCIRRNN